jgi:hypothetical protein
MNSKRFNLEPSSSPKLKLGSSSKSIGEKRFSNIFSLRNSLAGLFLLQLVILFLLVIIINPGLVFEQLSAVNIINKVSDLVSVPPTEVPVIARVGDNKGLEDVETLKKSNDVNAQVYKDAQNGDYVLLYSSKLIIYRAGENKVVYEGNTPEKILKDTQVTLMSAIVSKAKERGLISNDSNETPQIAVVTDVNAVKATNSTFYANVQLNDILATFSQSSIVILYRPSSNTIVNSGSFSTTIN